MAASKPYDPLRGQMGIQHSPRPKHAKRRPKWVFMTMDIIKLSNAVSRIIKRRLRG